MHYGTRLGVNLYCSLQPEEKRACALMSIGNQFGSDGRNDVSAATAIFWLIT